MDGFELCHKIKTDERTSHIPVILLTAKATSKDKTEGYETGADDYIMKPFDAVVLKVRIKNLIEQRRMLREHFKKEGLIELEDKEITSIDKKFLKNVFQIIQKNLSDTNFSVEILADAICDLIDNPSQRERFNRYNLRLITEKADHNKLMAQMETVYRSMIR